MPRLQEQERAKAALAAVREFKSKAEAEEYRQLFQQLPSRILASGLGQAMAFSASKGGKEEDVAACVATFLLKKRAKTIDLLAEIMAGLGYTVSGSDLQASATTVVCSRRRFQNSSA